MVARTGRKLAIVHGPQLAAQRLFGDGEAELLPEPRDQIDQTPAYHAVEGRNGSLLDDGLQGLSVLIGEPRRGSWRPARQKALRSPGGPRALKRSTQSRTICSVTQPI